MLTTHGVDTNIALKAQKETKYKDCNKTGSWEHTAHCMAATVERRIRAEGSGVGCMPFSYKGVFGDHLDLPDCQDEGEASQTLRKINAWYGEASNTFGDACPVPCDSITYTMRSSRLAKNSCYESNRTSIWVYFDMNAMLVEEEYRLMDEAAILSATGGSLGLFLGFSCLGIAWDACNLLAAAVTKRGFPGLADK